MYEQLVHVITMFGYFFLISFFRSCWSSDLSPTCLWKTSVHDKTGWRVWLQRVPEPKSPWVEVTYIFRHTPPRSTPEPSAPHKACDLWVSSSDYHVILPLYFSFLRLFRLGIHFLLYMTAFPLSRTIILSQWGSSSPVSLQELMGPLHL